MDIKIQLDAAQTLALRQAAAAQGRTMEQCLPDIERLLGQELQKVFAAQAEELAHDLLYGPGKAPGQPAPGGLLQTANRPRPYDLDIRAQPWRNQRHRQTLRPYDLSSRT